MTTKTEPKTGDVAGKDQAGSDQKDPISSTTTAVETEDLTPTPTQAEIDAAKLRRPAGYKSRDMKAE